jgi:hypothetical protein
MPLGSGWVMLAALLAGSASASEWRVTGDLRSGVFASERVARDGDTRDLVEARARLRVAFAREVASGLGLRARVAGRYGSEQDEMRAYLRGYAPTRTGAELGDTTLDELHLEYAPDAGRWSLRAGRFQSRFELIGVASKSLDRNDSPNTEVNWTDGVHWRHQAMPGWQAHVVLQNNHRRGSSVVTRAPLDFSASDSRVSVFAGLEASKPAGPWVQRMIGLTWMPDALATDGVANPRRDDYVTLVARTALAWPTGSGEQRWLFGAELGHAPQTPGRAGPLGMDGAKMPGGNAWQLSATLEHLAPGHHLGLVIGRADAGWLLSPDFRNNDELAEIRYQWRINGALSFEARYRWRSELVVPDSAARSRVDRDAYARVTLKF